MYMIYEIKVGMLQLTREAELKEPERGGAQGGGQLTREVELKEVWQPTREVELKEVWQFTKD